MRLLNRRSPDGFDVLSTGNFGTYFPYSMRGAMYGNWTFPVDAEYELLAPHRELPARAEASCGHEARGRRHG